MCFLLAILLRNSWFVFILNFYNENINLKYFFKQQKLVNFNYLKFIFIQELLNHNAKYLFAWAQLIISLPTIQQYPQE